MDLIVINFANGNCFIESNTNLSMVYFFEELKV